MPTTKTAKTAGIAVTIIGTNINAIAEHVHLHAQMMIALKQHIAANVMGAFSTKQYGARTA